jgi:hypothetical protein
MVKYIRQFIARLAMPYSTYSIQYVPQSKVLYLNKWVEDGNTYWT